MLCGWQNTHGLLIQKLLHALNMLPNHIRAHHGTLKGICVTTQTFFHIFRVFDDDDPRGNVLCAKILKNIIKKCFYSTFASRIYHFVPFFLLFECVVHHFCFPAFISQEKSRLGEMWVKKEWEAIHHSQLLLNLWWKLWNASDFNFFSILRVNFSLSCMKYRFG